MKEKKPKEEKKEKKSESESEKEQKPEPKQEQEGSPQEDSAGEEKQEDFKSKYLYLAAELDNQRKRFQRERESLFKFGGEKILGDLIQVADNLERTIDAIQGDEDEKVKKIMSGVAIVKKQFLDTLARHGLTPVESLGKDFDPNVHEAMAQEESDQGANKIIRVFEQGYMLNGRLLRAAKVIVSK